MKQNIDEAFLGMAQFIVELAALEGTTEGFMDEEGISMEIQEATIGLPFQLDLITDEKEEVRLGAAPPLYYVETSIMPVFHQLQLTLVSAKT